MSEPVYAVHLWRDDRHEQYCGTWSVPCPDGDPFADRVRATERFGLFRDEDGTVGRAWFFADELPAQIDRAALVTECYTEAVECRPEVFAA